MSRLLESIVGPEHIEMPASECLDGVKVDAIVRPGDASEVAACLRKAGEAGLALVVSGSGTKLGWGNPSSAPSLIRLDLGRLVESIDIQADEGIATVSAGVPVATLAERLQAVAKTTCISDPFPDASVGGTVATDPIGPEYSAGRALRNDLLGMQVALCTGELARAGGRVVKNVTGFDLVRLYCGSMGTLGVITEVTLRLRPRPEVERAFAVDFPDLAAAIGAASSLRLGGVEPAGVLVLPDASGARLIWRIAGTEDDVTDRADRFAGEPVDLALWRDAGQRLCAVPESCTIARIGARPSETLAILSALAPTSAPRAMAGVGPGILAVLPGLGMVRSTVDPAALPALFETCRRADWALFIEQTSPDLKARFDVFGPEPGTLPLMRALKARFDPQGVLSPGRFMGRL